MVFQSCPDCSFPSAFQWGYVAHLSMAWFVSHPGFLRLSGWFFKICIQWSSLFIVYHSMDFGKCIEPCIHHHSTLQDSSIGLKFSYVSSLYKTSLPFSNVWQLVIVFTVSIVVPFTECHTNRIFKYMALGVWLLLLTRKYFKSHPFHCLNQYCWLYSITFYGCTHLPIYTPVQRYLGCFQFLMSKNKAV